MSAVRDFRLVLCADVLDFMMEHAMRTLEQVVEMEEGKEGLGYLPCKPLVIFERRTLRTRNTDYVLESMGMSQAVAAGAL